MRTIVVDVTALDSPEHLAGATAEAFMSDMMAVPSDWRSLRAAANLSFVIHPRADGWTLHQPFDDGYAYTAPVSQSWGLARRPPRAGVVGPPG